MAVRRSFSSRTIRARPGRISTAARVARVMRSPLEPKTGMLRMDWTSATELGASLTTRSKVRSPSSTWVAAWPPMAVAMMFCMSWTARP